jgi:hypothetical protein
MRGGLSTIFGLSNRLVPRQAVLDKPQRSTSYFAVPLDVMESPPELAEWARKAIAAAKV